jgi:hypothetical protein
VETDNAIISHILGLLDIRALIRTKRRQVGCMQKEYHYRFHEQEMVLYTLVYESDWLRRERNKMLVN